MTSQALRRARTRKALIEAARAVFAEKGFDAASTPEIAAAAGVSRGALYHHFEDKKALFRAVVEAMQADALAALTAAAGAAGEPVEALKAGAKAWIDTASAPDFIRIVMIDGPAALGLQAWRAIDRAHGVGSLERGLREARGKGRIAFRSARAMAAMLSGALNEAALVEAESAEEARADCYRDFCALIDGLTR